MRGVSVADLGERLDAQIVVLSSGCWLWTGGTNDHGYGVLNVKQADGRWIPRLVHRLAWERANGPIPEGLYVLHHCDNPPCCNAVHPDHLYLGDHAANMAEMQAHGRARKPGDFGERNGRAKLTDAQVESIRIRYAAGERQRALAAEFGITQGAVSSIVTGRTRSRGEV